MILDNDTLRVLLDDARDAVEEDTFARAQAAMSASRRHAQLERLRAAVEMATLTPSEYDGSLLEEIAEWIAESEDE